jgi:deoxyribonuclease V
VADRYGVVDVHYPADGEATAGLAVYADRRYATLLTERTERVSGIEPYRPGAFFERELPALRAVLTGVEVALLIVDSYVDLDPAGRPGLGLHVHHEFGVPVIGIAKTAFRSATHAVAVLRGAAVKPVFVTAAGIDLADAAVLVEAMAGPYRLPDAVRRVDALVRS